MSQSIGVLVVAPQDQQREVAERLAEAGGLAVVATATGPSDAAVTAARVQPRIVFVDLDRDDLDGIVLTEQLSTQLPWTPVVVAAAEASPDYLRRAMLAGARHFFTKPLDPQELASGIARIHEREQARGAATGAAVPVPIPAPASAPASAGTAREGRIITLYSAKGGVGCTTLACNLAVALKLATGKSVAIFDCGLLFGDVGVVLNVNPRQTIVDVLPHAARLDGEIVLQMMVQHASGVMVLLAPPSPEKAELVSPEHIRKILAALREQFDYVVIDTWPTFEERILHVLDASDHIVVPTTLEMPAIKNCRLLLDVTTALSYPPEKIVLALNRADSRGGIRVPDVERILQRPFVAEIVSDGRLTTHSLNEGVPFVMSHPEAIISQNVMDLARKLGGVAAPVVEVPKPKPFGGLLRTVLGSRT
jgi:pilus assembly protein CpaE